MTAPTLNPPPANKPTSAYPKQAIIVIHGMGEQRIVVVGHSLGSILAYDLISYFWATRYDPRTVLEHTPEFQALLKLERAIGEIEHTADPDHFEKARSTFLSAQREFCRLLRLRPRPTADAPDTRWLITDLVTLGSPLTHAEFLLARDAADLRAHQASRDFPVSPPIRELLDPPSSRKPRPPGFRSTRIVRSLFASRSVRPISGNFITPRPLLPSAGPTFMIRRCW
jgi:hypothetical protein